MGICHFITVRKFIFTGSQSLYLRGKRGRPINKFYVKYQLVKHHSAYLSVFLYIFTTSYFTAKKYHHARPTQTRRCRDAILVTCCFPDPVTGTIKSQEFNSVLLEKCGSASNTFIDPLSTTAPGTAEQPMFNAIFSIDGRIRRLEYGLTCILYWGALFILTALSHADFPILAFLIFIPVAWILLAQGVKRCHDIGNSGWWQLIPFYIFVMMFQDGDLGSNKYGPNPKGR